MKEGLGDVMVHRVSFWQKGSEFRALEVKGHIDLRDIPVFR